MSREAFYQHLCKRVMESVTLGYLPMSLTADLQRAAKGDVPLSWLGPDVVYAPSWEGLCTYHSRKNWPGTPDAGPQCREPSSPDVNWKAAVNQAIADIEQDGSESALAALPWLADWLIIEAKSGMGDGDE